VRFGDAQDPDFLDSLPLEHTAYAVSTLPDLDSNRALLHALQQSGFRGQLMVMARDEWQYQALARAGVTNLISPFRDAMDVTVEKLIQIIQTEKKTS
jgi:Trk K+ transport system NAD-binding subunit